MAMTKKIFFSTYWLLHFLGAVYMYNTKIIFEEPIKTLLIIAIFTLQIIYYTFLIRSLYASDLENKKKGQYLILFFVIPPFQIYYIWRIMK